VSVEADLYRSSPVVIASPAGKRNQTNACSPRRSTQFLGNFVSTQIRHANVQERHIRSKRLGHAQRGTPAVRHTHLMSCQLQEHRKRVGRVFVVIGDQHATGRCCGRRRIDVSGHAVPLHRTR